MVSHTKLVTGGKPIVNKNRCPSSFWCVASLRSIPQLALTYRLGGVESRSVNPLAATEQLHEPRRTETSPFLVHQ